MVLEQDARLHLEGMVSTQNKNKNKNTTKKTTKRQETPVF